MRPLAIALAALAAACVSPVDYGEDEDEDDPLPPPTEHDEDGDGTADGIDLCPTVGSGGGDADGDDVGDECDPQDGAGNEIAYLETFARPAAWEPDGGGPWAVADDGLVAERIADESAARTRNTVDGPLRVVARITVLEAVAAPELALLDAYDYAREGGDECYVTPTTLVNVRLDWGAHDTARAEAAALGDAALVVGQTYTLASHRTAGGVTCEHAGVAVERITPPRSGTLRIGARDARVRIESVIAYRLAE